MPEKPTKVLLLKKAPKKPAAKNDAEPALAPPVAAPEPKQTPQEEMTCLQLEKQKLQEELARLAAEEDEDEDEDGGDEASDPEIRMPTTAAKVPGAASPGESGDE